MKRRTFIWLSALTAATATLSACGMESATNAPQPTAAPLPAVDTAAAGKPLFIDFYADW